ncbi:PmoA family protein [Actinomadura sp. 6N118]|uniref:PmoA family protein n=1 Tax=Actinomadura sp. 6N118 TaxID=3375151 RepID=UPI0037AA6B8F
MSDPIKMSDPIELRIAGRPVARYVTRSYLAAGLAPRPYLHPVRTLGGTEVTELSPEDHPHHLGVCVAIADVSGRNFWGGRTYVRDRGPVWRDDHGLQRHLSWTRRAADEFGESLAWIDRENAVVLREQREATAVPLGDHWALDLTFRLTNVLGTPLQLGSSATKGRAGAGYGGFFWRAPGTSTDIRVFSADAEGEEKVHGAVTGWVAMSGTDAKGKPWTLAFAGGDEATRRDPWFVRAAEYPGVGSALAWEHGVEVPPGGVVARRIGTIVADGVLSPSDIEAGLEELWAR